MDLNTLLGATKYIGAVGAVYAAMRGWFFGAKRLLHDRRKSVTWDLFVQENPGLKPPNTLVVQENWYVTTLTIGNKGEKEIKLSDYVIPLRLLMDESCKLLFWTPIDFRPQIISEHFDDSGHCLTRDIPSMLLNSDDQYSIAIVTEGKPESLSVEGHIEGTKIEDPSNTVSKNEKFYVFGALLTLSSVLAFTIISKVNPGLLSLPVLASWAGVLAMAVILMLWFIATTFPAMIRGVSLIGFRRKWNSKSYRSAMLNVSEPESSGE